MAHVLVADDDTTTREMTRGILKKEGHTVRTASDGVAALRAIKKEKFDLVFLDIWMPKMNGLVLLDMLSGQKRIPKIVVMTSDKTSHTLMNALRGRVYQYLPKPFEAKQLTTAVENALSAHPETPAIEVLSAKPEWVELLVPCERSVVERLQSFVNMLGVDLPLEVTEKVGYAFRELLNNAIEWGGHFDPNQKVRISFIRTKKMLMYRLDDPGPGFKLENLDHAAINNPEEDPLAHAAKREAKGLRAGGLGLLLTQQMVDELVYNEARNQVVLVKYL
ncbi:MAG TPA: response regulator [Candidatus Acidoferrales bacterium]|nr:response regulator [Candidatus Acidoferrales bacterium]